MHRGLGVGSHERSSPVSEEVPGEASGHGHERSGPSRSLSQHSVAIVRGSALAEALPSAWGQARESQPQ